MFRDLCSCHKSKKKQQDADDDLPYSPNRSKLFVFLERKKKLFGNCERLTSTPNQLTSIKKLDENQILNMDLQNNNKYSTSNNSSISSNSSNLTTDLINSPIEKDSKTCINLDSNDELNELSVNNRLDLENRSPFQMYEQNDQSSNNPTESNDLNNDFLDPWSKSDNKKYLNDNNTNENFINSTNESTAFNKLTKNNSTNDLSKNNLSPFECSMRNKSVNSLSNLESNDKNEQIGLNFRKSFTDSTDNIIRIDSSKNQLTNIQMNNLLNQFENLNNDLLQKESPNFKNPNYFQNDNQLDKKKDELNKDHNNDLNQIENLINLPSTTGTLRRVSSDDKISLGGSSIESVVLDKHSNEIVKKPQNQSIENDKQSSIKQHANSIIIIENLTLTLKRDKSDKKSLNDFSIENMSKQIFETSAFAKEYFYDEPMIKTTSKFMKADLATYKMQSDPRGHCLIINNATTNEDCLRLKNGFNKEVIYFKDLFTRLGFIVEVHSNLSAQDILKLMKNVKKKTDFTNHDAFICIFFGHGNQNYVIGEDGFKVNLELMIGYLNNYHCPKLLKKPKIFILHTCNSTCQIFLEPIAPSNIPREIQALKKISEFKIIPTWTDTVIIYSPFVNSNLYFSPFVKEFGSLLCSSAFELSLHDILLQTNDQINKKEHYKDQYGVDFNYRGFNKALFFNPGHFISPSSNE